MGMDLGPEVDVSVVLGGDRVHGGVLLLAGTDDKANALHGWTCLSLALSAEGVTLLIDTNLRPQLATTRICCKTAGRPPRSRP